MRRQQLGNERLPAAGRHAVGCGDADASVGGALDEDFHRVLLLSLSGCRDGLVGAPRARCVPAVGGRIPETETC